MEARTTRLRTLTTERLLLRAIRLDDATDVHAYACKSTVARYTLWEPHASIEETEEFISSYALPNYALGVPDPLGITLLGEGRVVGTIGCFWASREHRCMELGYALDEPLWGRGIATEAARAVLDYVFAEYEVERVQARCKIENTASERVMEKLGMRHEGTLRSAVFHHDRYWDIAYRAVLRSERAGGGRRVSGRTAVSAPSR